MVEVKWFSTNSVPTTDEYLRNGAISTGVPTVFAHAFFLLGHGITNETIYLVESGDAALFSCPARILRLWDDLGSAKVKYILNSSSTHWIPFIETYFVWFGFAFILEPKSGYPTCYCSS